MIKLSIKNESGPDDEKEFKGKVYLEQDEGDEDIYLKIDINGEDWGILRINADGTFALCASLPDDIGLQVDEGGCILMEELYDN